MGTITINVDNETESIFREAAKDEYGLGKGKLGRAVSEALELWIEEKKQVQIKKRQLELIKKGFNLGKRDFKSRDDLYDRR